MASYKKPVVMITLAAVTVLLLLSSCSYASSSADQLSPDFYAKSCPWLSEIVEKVVNKAVAQNPRMGASLLRLHFHDCFGCDGSILLDDTPTFTGEKTAVPNNNSARGFEVIDQIKDALEAACPGVVSCADILAITARVSVDALGGGFDYKDWEVKFGRKDATNTSRDDANNGIPNPNMNLANLTSIFNKNGLSPHDLVVLAGAHTIGQARCTNFRARIYNDTNIDGVFAQERQSGCSENTANGDDDNLAPLDFQTPTEFDNNYYVNLVINKGLLHSDQQLYGVDQTISSKVLEYSTNSTAFLKDFGAAILKMGDIPPTGSKLEIRKNCRKVNTN